VKAAEAEATSESQLALLRGEWARVKDLAARVASLRRARAERHVEIDLGHQIYETPEIPIDPFSPGFGALFGRSRRCSHSAVTSWWGHSPLSRSWMRRGASSTPHAGRRSLRSCDARRRIAERPRRDRPGPRTSRGARFARQGDVESLMRMADTMLAKGTTGDADVAKSAVRRAVCVSGSHCRPFPMRSSRRRARSDSRTSSASPTSRGELPARDRVEPALPGAEEGSARAGASPRCRPRSRRRQGAQQLVDQFAIHPYVNSLGIRYLPPLETEWVLVEDFAEAANGPRTSPLLDALALTGRRALSRMRIEPITPRARSSVVEGLGLDVREYVLVCMPADVFVNVGARLGWGQQRVLRRIRRLYQLLRDGKLRRAGRGDARFGGLYDVCSIARDDAREGVVTRFAIVRRERMRTPGA